MSLTPDEIIEKIEAGEYEIRHEEDCCCQFDWNIVGDELLDGASGDE